MISPGDPEQAAELARRAGGVSHDGEAIYGAQVMAAMEAQAFVEGDIHKLLDVGVDLIPHDSLIYRLISDLRDWRGRYDSWYESYDRIAANYGYDRYGGNCHMIPNHALIVLALLYCDDSFHKAMTIVNTAGWDTDCNSANVGCLMGIKHGLAGLDAGPDFRGPVADRLYLPTADGGRAVSDALHEADEIVAMGRALAGLAPARPKGGARYHFDQPGAVQGWLSDTAADSAGTTVVENVPGQSVDGRYSLAIRYRGVAAGRPARALREVYPDYEHDPSHGYSMVACPSLYPGQTVRARLAADAGNGTPVTVRLFVRAYGANDQTLDLYGPAATVAPGAELLPIWTVEAPTGCPPAWIGVEITAPGRARADGTVYLDWLTWDGAPDITLAPPTVALPTGLGRRWLEMWVQGCDVLVPDGDGHHYRIIQNEGTGLALQGTREWRDYVVSATVTPHLAAACGLAAYAQGMKRYLALELVPGGARLVRELDGTHVLAETALDWRLDGSYRLELAMGGGRVVGRVDGRELFALPAAEALQGEPAGNVLDGGAIALLVAEGRAAYDDVTIRPL